jgi:threonine dehydrogenase-like Zn-dependent dehydrogenase
VRALTVVPGKSGSTAVVDLPEPTPSGDELLVEGLAVGVCGTDREITAGNYGWAPEGRRQLVLGHESLGRALVLENDVVVGSVNANLHHYRLAADALARADRDWLRRLITRRLPLDSFADALEPTEDDVKVVLTLSD